MRISELSRTAGVSVATIKFYLREGLLPSGTRSAPNQADYDDGHVHRLRLIRALKEVGRLDLARVRIVLEAVADERMPTHELLGVAHYAPAPRDDTGEVASDVVAARKDVDRFIEGLKWRVDPAAPSRRALADALVALRRLGRDVDADVFTPYAKLVDELGAYELEHIPKDESRSQMVERTVVGTFVFEAALVALRRLALEHHSARRFTASGSSSA